MSIRRAFCFATLDHDPANRRNIPRQKRRRPVRDVIKKADRAHDSEVVLDIVHC
jgi:hypothetical protein